ncbi:MAG: nucleoside hydrolase [Clostridiales bacterium]|nr:nucleoside hydrolase [Clostridiales bacterium]
MLRLLIDCDLGIDDSLALLYALQRPDAEIAGICVSAGNVSAAQGAENTLRVLKLAGKEGAIPVCVGAELPVNGIPKETAPNIHGANGIGNVQLPETDQRPVDMDFRDFLYEKACACPGELVLITLGRMTDIALTLQRYPDFSRKISRVVSMGGTLYTPGNVTPVAEANIAGDPEAADQVLCAGWNVSLVGLDVTLKTLLKISDLDKARRCCRKECAPLLDFIKEELRFYMNAYRNANYFLECCPLHDPLAMLTVFNPGLVTTRKMITRVECQGTYCRGMLVTDQREHPIEGRFVEHCVEVDSPRAVNMFLAAFQ